MTFARAVYPIGSAPSYQNGAQNQQRGGAQAAPLPDQPELQRSPTPTRKVSQKNPSESHLPKIRESPTNQLAISRMG